ncbi:MAG TPA: DUF819 family protein [Acidobacteriota bacterium]|nr:DUF819 family protein [Acidobacteriota bacterium]
MLLVLAAVVCLALWLEQRFAPFRALGAALVGILIGMALSNSGVLPGTSPTYQWLSSRGVSLSVALILINVNLRSLANAGMSMLAAFGIGAASTAAGAITGALLWSGSVGAESWKLAGQFTGTYTGGGMNFAALGRAFDTSSDLFSAAVAADVALTALWMAACLIAPLLLSPGSPTRAGTVDTLREEPSGVARALNSSVRPIAITELAALVMLAVGAVWLAGRLAALVPALPEILWLTTIALLLAQVPEIKGLAGGALLGNYVLLLFLASNGAQSVLANIFRVGPAVFWFAATTVVVHGIGIFGIGRLVGIDASTLAVASQANVGGPASAVALASARGYTDRLLPGVAIGLLGYAVGNYTGFMVANLMRNWLGG